MGSAHTWHPGNCPVGSHWAVPVPLLPDEIISSWLVRLALAHGCDPLTLTSQIWPKWRIWTQDSDRFFNDERIEQVSILSGMNAGSLKAASLYPFACQIQANLPKEKTIWPWILTTGARNIKRHNGIQYCPLCLASDADPYFRIQWRFAWHTVCNVHESTLLDRCQQCSAPVEPHRLIAEDRHITICPTCHYDFRAAKVTIYSQDASVFQNLADRVLFEGGGFFYELPESSAAWFEIAGFFVSLLRYVSRGGTEALNNFMKLLDVEVTKNQALPPAYGFEMLRTCERQHLLSHMSFLMNAKKLRFDTALAESNISKQGFLGNGHSLPVLIRQIAAQLPVTQKTQSAIYRPRAAGPRPKYQVNRMMTKIRRKIEMSQR